MNILVCGSLAYDRIMDFSGKFSEHILAGKTHILNLSFTVNGVKESFGGTGGNIAYNLALLGERPKIIAVAGKDFGRYQTWLKKNNLGVSGVKIVKNELTASAYIMTDKADNQITAFYPGSKIQTSPHPLLGKERGKGILAIIAPDIVARMTEYAKMFKRFKTAYIFDPGQQITGYNASELRYSISGAKALIGNDYEIQLILNKLKIKLKQLEKMVEILIITKGGQGSEIYNLGKKIIIAPAKPKAILDPTGAGDAYRAGFIKGLIMGWPLEICGRLASLVAVYTVEKYGTQTHSFSWREMAKRYEENYNENL
ncbi:MAG: carbohydrate kinase family protein [Parcubacteria group bacterium]|nr:carbohydrate kinase family protein [Parcubacteria group bacterium]